MISFTVSIPPTANNLFYSVPGKGRRKTPEYRAWIETNGWIIKLAAQAKKITGPYALHIDVGKPDNRRRDLDNLTKAVSDLIVSIGAVRDDSDCQRIQIGWSEHNDDCFVQVIETQPVPVRKRKAA
jgi:Holliday junction resolvase RusA-like endonuclease